MLEFTLAERQEAAEARIAAIVQGFHGAKTLFGQACGENSQKIPFFRHDPLSRWRGQGVWETGTFSIKQEFHHG